jgi:two-component system, OmpR family, response regulator CpxR
VSVITIVGAAFCKQTTVIRGCSADSGYKAVDLKEILTRACKASGMAAAKITGVFSAKTSVFNQFTLEEERSDSRRNRYDHQNRRGPLSDEHLPQV